MKKKSEQVNEWLKFLNENMKHVLITLEGEKMYVETIFREHLNGEEFLYWYSVQGEGGQEVGESDHWVDMKHLACWDECFDDTFKPMDLKTEVVMIPEKIRNSMKL
jgi:hypothetical protein